MRQLEITLQYILIYIWRSKLYASLSKMNEQIIITTLIILQKWVSMKKKFGLISVLWLPNPEKIIDTKLKAIASLAKLLWKLSSNVYCWNIIGTVNVNSTLYWSCCRFVFYYQNETSLELETVQLSIRCDSRPESPSTRTNHKYIHEWES